MYDNEIEKTVKEVAYMIDLSMLLFRKRGIEFTSLNIYSINFPEYKI